MENSISWFVGMVLNSVLNLVVWWVKGGCVCLPVRVQVPGAAGAPEIIHSLY